MSPAADENFRSAFQDADSSRAKLVPYLDGIHRTILDLLPEPEPGTPLRILDLGPGTGLLAERILRIHEATELTLLDFSETALANVRERLESYGERVRFESGDYVRTTFEGPYDAIIAELSVHNLNPKSMRTLFSASYAALRRGGVFVNADQVRGETETTESRNLAAWRRDAGLLGAPESEIDEAVELHTETRPPALATVVENMSADGFENVGCYFKQWCFAVMSGDKI